MNISKNDSTIELKSVSLKKKWIVFLFGFVSYVYIDHDSHIAISRYILKHILSM